MIASTSKKFTCPCCDTKISAGYAFTIADGKRYVCTHCGTHLVPKTKNVIYRRVSTIALTLLFALLYSYGVFDMLGHERSITNQFIMLLAVAVVFFLSTYLLIYRSVTMKKFED